MVAIPFDTLKFAEKLEAGGFTAQQARTAAEAFADATSQELATKADIVRLEASTKAEIAILRSDIEKIELRLTVKLGVMLAAAVAVIGVLLKLH